MIHFDLKCGLRLAALTLLLTGCAADPDEYNGSCTLSCSNPRVGSAQYTIESMNPEDTIGVPCQPSETGAANGPIRVQFRIYELRTRFGYPDSHLPTQGGGDTGGGFALQEGGGEGGGGGEETESPLSEPILAQIMKGGIGFEPVVYGGLAVDKTNDEHKDGPNSATPFRFAGIVTPSSEWCSDSCGVMSYEFWPTCGSSVNAGVAVHGTKSPGYTEFTLQNTGGG